MPSSWPFHSALAPLRSIIVSGKIKRLVLKAYHLGITWDVTKIDAKTPLPIRVVDAGVIIPTFNGVTRGFIFRAIDSVLNQTVRPACFLVIDDGSTDGTAAEIVGRYPMLTVVSKPNGGLPSARNFGLSRASTKYVCFLDDDDEWLPEKLATQIDFLDQRPEIGLVFSGIEYIDAKGRTLGSALPAKTGLGYPEILFGNSLLPPSAVMFRRSLIDTAGAFDEALRQGEDYEYFIRCAKNGRIGTQDALLVRYRQHAQQMSGSLTYIDDATIEIIRRHAQVDFPHVGHHFVQFFAYGASVRALLRRDFATARRFVNDSGGGFRPLEYLIRTVGILLAPFRLVKAGWRRFEHRRILKRVK